MTLTKPLHVLIAGGGLSGLALAQGPIKDGHDGLGSYATSHELS